MNKTELIAAIAEKAGITKTLAATTLEAFMASVTDALKAGDKVPLVGFGTFQVSARAAREARNPRDGKTIKIAAKKVARFKAGKKLDDAVNGVKATKK